jgi:hypothetical protein
LASPDAARERPDRFDQLRNGKKSSPNPICSMLKNIVF